jgi:hypothetical protein
MKKCQQQTDTSPSPGAVGALPAIEWPDEDRALDAALSAVQERIDAFAEGVELQLNKLDRQGALLEERAADVQSRDETLKQLRAELEQTQRHLLEEQEQQTAERAALEADRAALLEERAAFQTQADSPSAQDAPSDRGSGEVEQAAPDTDELPEATAGAPASGNTTVSPTESDEARMPDHVGDDAPVEPQEEAQPEERPSSTDASEPPAADITPPADPVTKALIDQPEELEAASAPAQGDVNSIDLDPDTAQKLRMLRRLSPGKSNAELLAQLQSRQPAEQLQDKAKKSWWKRGK